MPIYASPDEFKNGYAPAGSVVPQPETLPEGVNPKPPEEQPSVWGAAFRKNNMLAGLYLKPPQFEPVEGYNPYADKSELEGYDLRATAFAESRSPQETAWIKQQIDEEEIGRAHV